MQEVNDSRKGVQEKFAQFLESRSRDKLRDVFLEHTGEQNELDFKQEWPKYEKVARHVLGMANSGGGCIIFGVKEKDDGSFEPIGLESLLDKAKVHKGIEKFISTQLRCEVLDFSYSASEYNELEGKKFQVLLVEDAPKYLPFIAESDGEGIKKSTVYVRRGTSSEPVSYEEMQKIINRRVETNISTSDELSLGEHLDELRLLYRYLPTSAIRRRGRQYLPEYNSTSSAISEVLLTAGLGYSPSEQPIESFNDFIKYLIEEKKYLIEQVILRK